jgi:molybdenum cofactor biosynthesis enzyme MoaA
MHFSQMGVVTACCFNRTHVLGVYPRNSVDDIWNGEPLQELRTAMDNYDLTHGCEKCLQQIEARDFGGSHATFYSVYARFAEQKRIDWGMPAEGDPERQPLPLRLEFNIHNSCNLQCIMCHGLASSAIRTRREGLAPLDNPYDEAFVEQLTPYLPYVVEADFMGGEPFLIPTYTMLWEQIARRNPLMKVCILTNGTILDDRTRNLLEGFNSWIHVSIDSVFKDTYETIRRGASFEQVMQNCDYYLDLMERRGFPLIFRYCPMRLNWSEIPDAVRYCNERGIYLMYNQVDSPLNLSLATLPPHELRPVVEFLDRNMPAAGKNKAEEHNRQHYAELVQRLVGFLDPKNRLNGLQARLDTSAAVVGQYTKGGKDKGKRSTAIQAPAETQDSLTEAVKRYVITQLNVTQAERTGLELPEKTMAAVTARRAELKALLAGRQPATCVSVLLSEVMRTYSGVWGVVDIHNEEVFDKIAVASRTVAASPHRSEAIDTLLTTAPAVIYEALRTQSADQMTNTILRMDWSSIATQVDLPIGNAGQRPAAERGVWAAKSRAPSPPAPDRHQPQDSALTTAWPLSYQGHAGDPVPVRTQLTLEPDVLGPEAVAQSLRHENVLLAIRRLRIVATGYRVVASLSPHKHLVKIDFERAFIEGTCGSDRFAFEFEKHKLPSDLAGSPLKTLCWAFSMKSREFKLGSKGEYVLSREDDDSLMEAMSVVYNAPILLPQEPVAAGGQWTGEWTGTRRHQDTGALLNYRQTAWLDKIERGSLHACLRAETSGALEVRAANTTGDQRLQAHTWIVLDSRNGQVLSSKGSGTITSTYPAAGLEIVWSVEAMCDPV